MRNSWRLLRNVSYTRVAPLCSNARRYYHVHSLSIPRPTSELFTCDTYRVSHSHTVREFSSESVEKKKCVLMICDLFEKNLDVADVERALEQDRVTIKSGVVLDVLKAMYSKPEVARRFFSWVLEKDSGKMSDAGCNLMLEIFCTNRLVDEFWDMVAVMNNKGYRVFMATRAKALELFNKEGRNNDLEKLNEMFSTGSVDKDLKEVGMKVSKIVRNRVWGPDVEEEIRSLGVEFSGDILRVILDNLIMEPMKALIFFRWMEEMVKHDGKSYNSIARILGREDCIDRFWKIIEEMKTNEVEMELKTYSKVLDRFCKRKMMKDAVNLTQFAMTGQNKPSIHCCTFLLKKIAAGKEFDIELFSQLVKVVTKSGNLLTSSMLNSVLKSLTSAGRLQECNKVLAELMDAGFIPNGGSQSRLALALSRKGMQDRADEFVNSIQTSGMNLDKRAMVSLVEGYCISGNLDKAQQCFQDNYTKLDASRACHTFDILVHGYCSKKRALEVFKLMQKYIDEYQFRPWHKTYITLIKKLLVQGGFHEALHCLGSMQKNGYSLFIGPYIEYVSKSGTEDEAVAFLKATSSKKFPATSIARKTVQAFLSIGKSNEAQNFLSKCDRRIRYHPDILAVFASSQLHGETAPVEA